VNMFHLGHGVIRSYSLGDISAIDQKVKTLDSGKLLRDSCNRNAESGLAVGIARRR
jgi:hypothetical protein